MANVIGILLYKRAYSVLVEELIVIIVTLVFLYVQGYSGARRFLFAGLNRVAVRSRRRPAKSLVRAEGAAFNRYLIAHHKRRIKAHAELTYNINVFLFLVFLLKGKRARFCNRTEVLIKLVLGHSAAVIDYFKGAGVLVYFKAYFKIIGCYTHRIIGKRAEIELVQRVARVGNKLAQENFFMGIN